MARLAIAAIIVTLGVAASALAQGIPPAGSRPPKTSRFNRKRPRPKVPRRPTTQRRLPAASKQKTLFSQANELAGKVYRSGPWSKHAEVMVQGIESIWAQDRMQTETDLFAKQLLTHVTRRPPWDFNGRMNVMMTMVKDRYGLNDQQVKQLRVRFIRNSFTFFMQNAETLLPVAREIIDTRLANKPFTPEQVQQWSKVVRPVIERWRQGAGREVNAFAKRYLTPEQQAKVQEDLVIIDKRLVKVIGQIKDRWETGQWSPEMWGLGKDPVHMGLQAKLAAKGDQKDLAAKSQDTPPSTPPPPPVSRGPMRLGERPAGGVTFSKQDASSLPDETKWVAYVRQFCDRYGLSKAQKASAYAILKDLQEQAQAYRSSRSEEIKRLEARIRKGESAEDRREAQAELRDVLRGIEELFERLKSRLESIPTADQLRRVG